MIMQDRFRSRIWDHEAEEMIDNVFGYVIDPERGKIRYYRTDETQPGGMGTKVLLLEAVTLEQCVGLNDSSDRPYFIGDIGEFPNGDRFVVCCESWLEMFVDWIGEAKLEDQARDVYRIDAAKIIGNIHQNKDLLGA